VPTDRLVLSNWSHLRAVVELAVHTPSHELVQQRPLAHRRLFWSAISVCVMYCVSNMGAVASEVWEKWPTVRMLLQMVLTATWAFPPAVTDSALIMAALEDEALFDQRVRLAVLAAKDEALAFEARCAAAEAMATKALLAVGTCASDSDADLIDFNLTGPIRRPPADVLAQLQQLDSELKLGQQLRSCRQPDFLLKTISLHERDECSRWLMQLMATERHSTLVMLPARTLCEVLYNKMMTSEPDAAESQESAVLNNQLLELLADPANMQPIVAFFTSKLESVNIRSRKVVHACLLRLFPMEGCDGDVEMADDDVMNETGHGSAAVGGSWLRGLCAHRNFKGDIPSELCTALAKASLVETSPAIVALYMRFLMSERPPQVSSFALAVPVCRMLVDRRHISTPIIADGELARSIVLFLRGVIEDAQVYGADTDEAALKAVAPAVWQRMWHVTDKEETRMVLVQPPGRPSPLPPYSPSFPPPSPTSALFALCASLCNPVHREEPSFPRGSSCDFLWISRTGPHWLPLGALIFTSWDARLPLASADLPFRLWQA
jgi:hypothetical protein